MIDTDALVVGGGPAGSSAARALVAAGLRVIVIDRARFPRDKVCAGWITPAVIDLLHLDLTDYRRSRVCQPIDGFRTSRMGGPVVDTRFDRPVSYGICRVEFDDYLLRRSGATIVEDTPVTSLSFDGERWVVNEAYAAPVVVGAGGHLCPVARHLGARPADETAIAAQEVEFPLTPRQQDECRIAPSVPELWLCRDMKGYGWCVRKGDRLNVGLGRLDPQGLPAHVRAFLSMLIAARAVPADTPTRWKGHAYLLRDLSPRRIVETGAVLVGDAAGLAATISGEGIRPAIESGQAAARAIVEAGGRCTRERLDGYRAWLDKRYPRGRYAALEALPASMVTSAVGRLLGTAWFTRRVLLERWFLQQAA